MKNLIIKCLFLLSITSVKSQAIFLGTISYFDNETQLYKADTGSKVYLIDTTHISKNDYLTLERFVYGTTYRQIYAGNLESYEIFSEIVEKTKGNKNQVEKYNTYKKLKEDTQKDLEQYKTYLLEYNAETDDKFRTLDTKALEILNTIYLSKIPQKIVDENGYYSFTIPSGIYTILIVSNHKKGIAKSDSKGQIFCIKLNILDNETIDVSKRFR